MAEISREFLEIMRFEQPSSDVYVLRVGDYIVFVTYENLESDKANCYITSPLLFELPHWGLSNLHDAIDLRDLIEYLRPTQDCFIPCDLSEYGFLSMGKSQSIRSGQHLITAVTQGNHLQIAAYNGKMRIVFKGVCDTEDLKRLIEILFGSPEAV